MTQEINRRKALTEYLGECWHELPSDPNTDREIGTCVKCHKFLGYLGIGWDWAEDVDVDVRIPKNRTFTDWDDLGALKDKLVEKGDWMDFYYHATRYLPTTYIHKAVEWLLNPTRFAELVGEWLEQQEAQDGKS